MTDKLNDTAEQVLAAGTMLIALFRDGVIQGDSVTLADLQAIIREWRDYTEMMDSATDITMINFADGATLTKCERGKWHPDMGIHIVSPCDGFDSPLAAYRALKEKE